MELLVQSLEFASFLLIGIGVLFVWVDYRAGFDRIFRYFGASLIFISFMAAIDLYTGGADVPVRQKLIGQRILHEIACVFFPFSATYLMLIADLRIRWAKNVLIGGGFAFAALAPTGLMLGVQHGVVKGGPVYLPLFFPFAIFYILLTYYVLTVNLLRSGPANRKFAFIHLLAFIILTISGLLDMIGIIDPSWKLFVSYKIFGILIFGAMSAYVFTERFFMLLQERQETFNRLEILRKRIDAAEPLREIGESTVHISHEIKNYLATMKANSQLIRLKAGDEAGVEADRIERSAERLESFTRSILAYSSAAGNLSLASVRPKVALEDCVREFFAGKEADIMVEGDEGVQVRGDKAKLEQVYLNLIRNAFEANAVRIRVRVSPRDRFCRVEIEDDGPGCSPQELGSLGKPFYSKKKQQGGTGLGIAISRAIVEGIGGNLHFRTKPEGSGKSGLIAIMDLPLAAPDRIE